jgi:mannonate dehydratase
MAAVSCAARHASSERHRLKLGKGLRDLARRTLDFFRMLGIRHVAMPTRYSVEPTRRGLVPRTDTGPASDTPREPWNRAELSRIKARIEDWGLTPMMVHLGRMNLVTLGRSGGEREIEAVKANLRLVGELGIPVVEYNFTPLRGSEGYSRTTGRGGIGLRDYDEARTRGLPPLPNVGEHTREQMWERLESFLREVVPVAEEAGVRLALHPNDPPIPVFRGAAQPVRSIADQKRLIEVVNSPANGITLDTGVTTEMGDDAAEAIRYFGSRDRINHVHFRNVRVDVPYYKYLEVRHDAGDCDMVACMKAFAEVGYRYLLIPDHTPEFAGDTVGSEMGWAFAIGYLRALQHAAEA